MSPKELDPGKVCKSMIGQDSTEDSEFLGLSSIILLTSTLFSPHDSKELDCGKPLNSTTKQETAGLRPSGSTPTAFGFEPADFIQKFVVP
jgi:hypothetical protein